MARSLGAGCGTGQVGRDLQLPGYKVIGGFDLSPEMAEQATDIDRRIGMTQSLDIRA
jgi:predicted TPR repeat methyltransferase